MVFKGSVSFSPQLLPSSSVQQRCAKLPCPSALLPLLCLPSHTGAFCLCSFDCSTQWGLQDITFLNQALLKHPQLLQGCWWMKQCLDLQGSCQLESLVFWGTAPATPSSRRFECPQPQGPSRTLQHEVCVQSKCFYLHAEWPLGGQLRGRGHSLPGEWNTRGQPVPTGTGRSLSPRQSMCKGNSCGGSVWFLVLPSQHSWIALTCFCSLGSSCCCSSFCSLSSCSPPPSLDLPCQMDFDCL